MSESRWRLNNASVAYGATFTRDSGSLYNLTNISGNTLTGTSSSPSPQEGTRSYGLANNLDKARISTVFGVGHYIDFMIYMPTGAGYTQPMVAYGSFLDEGDLSYYWVGLDTNNAIDLAFYYTGFGGVYEQQSVSAPNAFPRDAWFRLVLYVTSGACISYAGIFRGDNLLGTIANTAITGYDIGFIPYDTYFNTNTNGGTFYIDDVIINDTVAPSRAVAPSLVAYGPSIRR